MRDSNTFCHKGKLDPTRVVFTDETWAKTNMTRTHGRCACGARLVAKVPHGRWRTLTFLAALRCHRIDAPMSRTGAAVHPHIAEGWRPAMIMFLAAEIAQTCPPHTKYDVSNFSFTCA